MKIPITKPCPCGSDKKLINCCYPIILDHAKAITAEQLMRSRYTAYSLNLTKHIMKTMLKTTDHNNSQSIKEFAQNTKFVKLTIVKTIDGSAEDTTGSVEFKAIIKQNNSLSTMHECSKFKKINAKWYYIP